ncbi:MAG: electron transport complex subunit RsxC [Clostridia bacterium]
MSRTFKGGVHPKENKDKTATLPIEELMAPEIMIYPLKAHIGAMNSPLVKLHDTVLVGQLIGDTSATMTVPTHSSVSGEVIAIEPREASNGSTIMSIVIKNDFKYTELKSAIKIPRKDKTKLTLNNIIKIARDAGLSGMGGAAFPTAVKISSISATELDYLIINGAECEPYITADHRAMVEYPKPIISGIKLLAQALHPTKIILAIEDNKEDAIMSMKDAASGTDIEVRGLKTKYPQGGEKQLIKVLTGREVPPGKLPSDVHCAVFNVDTCASLHRAITHKMPVIKRVVTVSGGGMKEPKNLLVRIGTPVSHLIEYCGGVTDDTTKIVLGGPMMGFAGANDEMPVTKSTSAVLALTKSEYKEITYGNCIHCGRCVNSCPMRIMPMFVDLYATTGDFDSCEKYNIVDCIECGCCSYVCPARLPLISIMRYAKSKVLDNIKAREAK